MDEHIILHTRKFQIFIFLVVFIEELIKKGIKPIVNKKVQKSSGIVEQTLNLSTPT